MRRGAAGLTLIELVVAMAILALLSVLGLQGLTAMLQMQGRLETRADATEDLARAVALLRADLGAAVPVLFVPPGGAPEPAVTAASGALALSVGGQPTLGGSGPGLGRVVWRIDPGAGRLTRQSWTGLQPAGAAAAAPETPVMTGVRGLTLRSYLGPAEGWTPGAPLSAAPARTGFRGAAVGADPAGASPLPQALEVTLDTDAFGPVTVIETLR